MSNEKNCGGGAPISIGSIWFIMWLFTMGYADLSFWKAVLALIIWPYFLGASVA